MLREKLRAILPDTFSEFAIPSPRHQPLEIARPMALSEVPLSNESKGLYCRIQEQMISVSWRLESNAPYPRFDALISTLQTAVDCLVDIFGPISFTVCQCHYLTTTDPISVDQDIHWALNPSVFGGIVALPVDTASMDLRFLPSDKDPEYAVSIRRGRMDKVGPVFMIHTTSATVVKASLADSLKKCHSFSNEMFHKIISSDAELKWFGK